MILIPDDIKDKGEEGIIKGTVYFTEKILQYDQKQKMTPEEHTLVMSNSNMSVEFGGTLSPMPYKEIQQNLSY